MPTDRADAAIREDAMLRKLAWALGGFFLLLAGAAAHGLAATRYRLTR